MFKNLSEYVSKIISKKNIIFIFVWALLVMLMTNATNDFFSGKGQEDYNDASADFYDVSLYGCTMQQELETVGYVEKMSFIMKNKSDVAQNLYLTLYESDGSTEIVGTVIQVAASDGEEVVIEWNLERDLGESRKLILEMKSDCPEDTLSVSVQDKSFDATYYENGELTDAHVRMAVVHDAQAKTKVIVYSVALIALTLTLFFIRNDRSTPIERVFVVVALTAGIVYAFINPFGQEPDGWVHFTRAMDVSYGNWLAPFVDNNGSSMIMNLPANIHEIAFRKVETTGADAVSYMQNIKSLYLSKEVVAVDGLGGFTSLFYMPQALGLCVGRLMGLSVFGLMVWGRLFNLITYITLTYFGLKKMPVYKNVFLVVALMPMTIYQAASFSYDGMLMGLCFLFIGLCFHYAYQKETLSWKNVIILGVILGLLCLCKYVYVCIGLLVFIIPIKKFGDVKKYWKSFAIALIPIVVILGAMLLKSSVITVSTETVTDGVDQITPLGYVLANPMFLIKVIIRTIPIKFSFYVEQLSTLGWLNFVLEPLRYLLPIFACVVAVLDTKEVSERQTIKDKIIYLSTFAITVLAGMLGLYLMDTVANPVGTTVIQGYQGRYTIPVLMLLLMAMGSKKIENKIEHFSYKVVGVMSMFLCATAVILIHYCY